MKNVFKVVGLALAMVPVFGGSAKAQDDVVINKWTLKLGVATPSQGTYRNITGNPQYALGVDFHPNFSHKILNGEVIFSAEALYRENVGRNLTIPLTGRVEWTIAPSFSGARIYGGIGAGIFIINTGTLGGTTQPGAKFVLGADINSHFTVQLNYNYISGFSDNLNNGLRADSLTLYAGFRF